MPPVTNTGIPVLLAAIIVLDTVVAPVRPCKVQMLSYNTFCNKILAATFFRNKKILRGNLKQLM